MDADCRGGRRRPLRGAVAPGAGECARGRGAVQARHVPGGQPFVGIVLRDSIIIDAGAANQELLGNPHAPAVQLPTDMKGIISAYEYGAQRRLYDIVNWAVRDNRLSGERRAPWVHEVTKV